MRRMSSFAVAAASALAFTVSSARGAVVLDVDVSNPAAVTFTATGNVSQIDDSGLLMGGVDLLGFFASDPGSIKSGLLGDLRPSSAASAYGTMDKSYLHGDALNLSYGASGTQTFSTITPAFAGAGTADLGSYSALLPVAGDSGNVAVGGPVGAVVGQWQVVPEPGVLTMLVAGGATLVLRRRRH